MEELQQILEAALACVERAETLQALDAVRVDFLGKKGQISQLMKGLGHLSAEERPHAGAGRARAGARGAAGDPQHDRRCRRRRSH